MMNEELERVLKLFTTLEPSWVLDKDYTPSDEFSRQRFEIKVEDGEMHGHLGFEFTILSADIMYRSVSVRVYLYPSPQPHKLGHAITIFENEYKLGSEEYSILKSYRDGLSIWQPIRKTIEEKRNLTDKMKNKYLR